MRRETRIRRRKNKIERNALIGEKKFRAKFFFSSRKRRFFVSLKRARPKKKIQYTDTYICCKY